MSDQLTALMEECARQRGALLLQLHDLNAKLNAATADLDERNQILQIVILLLDDVAVGRVDEDAMRLAADLLPRIAALGGRRA